jgi:uncharacterized protein YraI
MPIMRKLRHLPQLMLALALLLGAVAIAVPPAATSRAQDFGVTVTPNRERINVRIAPAIGHEVIGVLEMGQVVNATGRSGNNRWLRINFFGQEGWVEKTVVVVAGNPDVLPLGGPTVAALDLGDGPRAGPSNAVGQATIRLPRSGIRFRAGPSEAYFVMGNIPRYEVVAATGRSPDSQWLQVQYRGTLGWIANLDLYLDVQRGSIEALPIYGVVADGPPVNEPETGPYATRDAIMVAMLLHIDMTANKIDFITGIWNTIALGQATSQTCNVDIGIVQPYIPRDGDLIEYPELDPVIATLNEGLDETNAAIAKWEQWCGLLINDYPGGLDLIEPALENLRNARSGYAEARALIMGLGLEPTPTPLPPAFTPAAPVATVTPESLADLPDLMAFGLTGNRVIFAAQFTQPELGCNWQGIGGQIQGLNGQPLIGYTIRVEGVTDPTMVLETVSGSEPAYGPSGWEIKVADGPNSHVYRVTLYQNDRRVSDPRQVAFPNDCGRNLGIMNFDQLTPLE